MNRMIDMIDLSDWCSKCMVCAWLMYKKNTSEDCDRRDNNINTKNSNNDKILIEHSYIISAGFTNVRNKL